MDKLSALSGFVQSVNLGSFSAAAKHLGVSQPAVSQQVRGLEDQLGTRLLNRTTRQLQLTEAGERYYAYARDILERMIEADRSIQSDETQMSGPLSIGLPLGFAESVLSDFLIRFKKEHPCLLLDISLSDQFVDVIQERDPDVIEWHNIFAFDLQYLAIRYKRHRIAFSIGRDGSVPRSFASSMRFAERTVDFPAFDIAGRHVIDAYLLLLSYDVINRDLHDGMGRVSRKVCGHVEL